MNKFLYIFFAFAFLYLSFHVGRLYEKQQIPEYQEAQSVCDRCVYEAEVVKTKLDTYIKLYDTVMFEIEKTEKMCRGVGL